MMTGAVSGCRDNDCEPAINWTISREAARRGASAEGAAIFSSWERVARAVPRGVPSILLRAGRDSEEQAPPFPGHGAYRPDRSTAALAIAHLVAVRPRFLWVALGDTDEWAHRGDYRGYLEALHFADAFVGELASHLEEMGRHAALFVTTDHGRDSGFAQHGGPDSAGVWLMARGAGIGHRGVVGLDRPHHLRDIAPTMAALVGAPRRDCATCGEVMDELLERTGDGEIPASRLP
jgi:arylsulfatase A-like enzyme